MYVQLLFFVNITQLCQNSYKMIIAHSKIDFKCIRIELSLY